ncbi:oligosaccharide flippase family protein [bacterium]|nr:oligosaccharide flippase family protein [bacterium]
MDKEPLGFGRSRLVENTVSLVISGIFGVVLTLTQLSILSRFLEGEIFGLFIALRGFNVLLATLILMGLPQVLMRFLPSYQGREQRRKALSLFLTSIGVVLFLGGFLYAGSGMWREWIPDRLSELFISDDIIFWITLASISLAFKLLLYGGFKGLRVMSAQMILELSSLVLFTGYIFFTRNSLAVIPLFRALFVINSLVCLSGYPAYFRLSKRLIGEREISRGNIILPSFLSYWVNCVILGLVALAFTDIDRFVMSSMLPVATISVFHIGSRINVLVKRFLGFPILALQPEVTRIYEEGRWGELKGKILLFTKGTFVASLLLIAVVAVTGRDIIMLISGAGYEKAYIVLLILLPTVPIAAFIAPLLVTMKGLHYIKWALLCDLIWMIIYFGGFPFFVSYLGLPGMAIAQLFASLIQMIGAVLIARKKGFYGGLGNHVFRAILIVVVITPVGILAANIWGLWVSVLSFAVFPFLCRFVFRKIGLFEPSDVEQILDLIKFRHGKRIAGWFLTV